MPKRILIVDFTTHHPEVVRALLTLFGPHRVRLAVTASFSEKYLAAGGDDALVATDPLVRSRDEPEEAWLARLAEVVRDQDLVLVSTPIKNSLLARTLDLATSARKVLFLHNVNYFLDLEPLDLALFARLRAPGRPPFLQWPAWLLERRKQRRKAAKLRRAGADFAALDSKVDFYCFGSDSVARYFEQRSGRTNTTILPTNTAILPTNTAILRTNASFRGAPCHPDYRGCLHVAIIGTLSQLRKDYRGVLTALIAADLRRPVILSLLGRCPDAAFGLELAALVASNTNRQLEIRFDPTRRYISTATLFELLQDVHVLLNPAQPDTEFRMHREVYGLSKVSGAEGDCLAYGRPLLLPRSYVCARYAEPLTIQYEGLREMVAMIDDLNDAATLRSLHVRVYDAIASDIPSGLAASFLEKVLPGAAAVNA